MKTNFLLFMLTFLLPTFMYGQELAVSGTVQDPYKIFPILTVNAGTTYTNRT